MASAPSLSEETATSLRVSVVRTGDGAEPWLAEVDERPDCSGRGATPEEAVRQVWAAANRGSEADTPRRSGKLLVRMPATLHDELARAAESEGVSLNQLITGVLAGAVEWRFADAPPETTIAGLRLSARTTSILFAANLVLLVVAAIIAISLLVAAWAGL